MTGWVPGLFVALAAAAYAHAVLRSQSASAGAAKFTRTLLILTGTAFGMTMAVLFGRDGIHQALVAITGFGLVHVPAACILFLKRIPRD